MKLKIINFIKSYIIIIVILALWFLASYAKIWSEYVLPSPNRVFISFIKMLLNGSIIENVYISLIRVIVGFCIAFVLAFCLGMIFGIKPYYFIYFERIIEFMRNIPPISLIALLILWFGIGEKPKIIVIVLASFFPMFLNIKHGISSCDIKLIEVGKSLGFAKNKTFFKIILPYAQSDILVGMRIGLGYGFRAIIGAEMIASASGLGYLILDSQQLSKSDRVIVGIISIGILGYICDRLFSLLIKNITHGRIDENSD